MIYFGNVSFDKNEQKKKNWYRQKDEIGSIVNVGRIHDKFTISNDFALFTNTYTHRMSSNQNRIRILLKVHHTQ